MIVVFAGLLILQAFAFLLRNALALRVSEEIVSHPKMDSGDEKESKGTAAHLA